MIIYLMKLVSRGENNWGQQEVEEKLVVETDHPLDECTGCEP